MADQQQQLQQHQLTAASSSQDFDFITPLKSPTTTFQPQQQQQLIFSPMVQSSQTPGINYGNFAQRNFVKQEAYQVQLGNMNLVTPQQAHLQQTMPQQPTTLNEVSPSMFLEMTSPSLNNLTPNSFIERLAPPPQGAQQSFNPQQHGEFNINIPPRNPSLLTVASANVNANNNLLATPSQHPIFTPNLHQTSPSLQQQAPHSASIPNLISPSIAIQPPTPQSHQPSPVPLHQVPNINLTPHHSQNDVIRIVQGFNKLVTQKQPGGRDNTKHSVQAHVVELNPLVVSQYPDMFAVAGLVCKAYVLGYDKVSRNKVILGDAGEGKFTETFSQQGKRYLAQFTNLIVKFSSHLNGQKLALRFILYNTTPNKTLNQITFIDSEEFETITKRGQEKAAQRRKRKLNEFDTSASVEGIEPPMGLTFGGDLVKVLGRGFNCSPVNQVIVKFGDKLVKEVHVVKRNSIIVETPENEAGYVDVNVWLDKKTPLQSEARFQYIDPNNLMELHHIRDYLLQRKQEAAQAQYHGPDDDQDENFSVGGQSSTSGNASPWMQGKETDECGFTILHHACARGYIELVVMLLQQEENFDIERRDNFGRTAIFWSMWAGSLEVTEFLLSKGAQLEVADEVGETPLHLAVQQCHTAVTKQLFLNMLKRDNDNREMAQMLLRLIDMKNTAGDSALDLAEDLEDECEIASVLRATKRVCEKRVAEANIPVYDMTFKSGPLVAQTMQAAMSSLVQCKLCLSNNSLVLTATMTMDDKTITSRAVIDHDQVLFLILAKSQQRIEFTLKSAPRLVEGNDANISKLFASQSFHVQTSDLAIETINFHFSKSNALQVFQPYCFSAKQNDAASLPTAQTPAADEPKKKSKMGQLRIQMEKMNIKASPVSSPAISPAATSLHTLQQL